VRSYGLGSEKIKDFGTLLKDPAFPERTYTVGSMCFGRGLKGCAEMESGFGAARFSNWFVRFLES
jgi:hypothetical protein